MALTVLFETHGTSLDNEAGLASGIFDSPLSERGERQAIEMGGRYAGRHLDMIFCSDLQRSVRTAEIAFGECGVPIGRDVRLRECDYGDWTRYPVAHIDAEKHARVSQPFPNGESYAGAMDRTLSFLRDLTRSHFLTVLIVGHRATYYGLEHLLGGRDLLEVVAAPWQWQPGWKYVLDAASRSVK